MNAIDETETPSAAREREYLRNALQYSPASSGPIADNLRGWWTPNGWFVCAKCAGRMLARGCNLPAGSEPVWKDRADPYGDCCGCEF